MFVHSWHVDELVVYTYARGHCGCLATASSVGQTIAKTELVILFNYSILGMASLKFCLHG